MIFDPCAATYITIENGDQSMRVKAEGVEFTFGPDDLVRLSFRQGRPTTIREKN